MKFKEIHDLMKQPFIKRQKFFDDLRRYKLLNGKVPENMRVDLKMAEKEKRKWNERLYVRIKIFMATLLFWLKSKFKKKKRPDLVRVVAEMRHKRDPS